MSYLKPVRESCTSEDGNGEFHFKTAHSLA